jgi:hypothetical protein
VLHRVGSILTANIRLGMKGLSGSNALAYLVSLSVMKKKKHFNINTRPQCYKTFYDHNLLMFEIATVVVTGRPFSLVKCLQVRPGAYPRVEHMKEASQGRLLLYTQSVDYA